MLELNNLISITDKLLYQQKIRLIFVPLSFNNSYYITFLAMHDYAHNDIILSQYYRNSA